MNLTDNFGKQNKGKKADAEKDIEYYTNSHGHARNVVFVQPGGDMELLYYSDLVRGKFHKESGDIELMFRADTLSTVKLKGRNLQKLFNSLANHLPQKIACLDKRYEATKEEDEIVVTDIAIGSSSP